MKQNKNNKRENLVNQLVDLRKKESEIKIELNKIDYEEKFSKSKQYVGKCYSLSDEYIHSIFFYDIKKDNCKLMSLVVSDFSDGKGTHFGIEQSTLHNPDELDSSYNYKKITRKKFNTQLQKVQKHIQNALKNGK